LIIGHHIEVSSDRIRLVQAGKQTGDLASLLRVTVDQHLNRFLLRLIPVSRSRSPTSGTSNDAAGFV
jgi:hypothetical protein